LRRLCFNEKVKEFAKRQLSSPKTLGERLKAYRKRNRLTLEQAEEETKIRLKYLAALEKGDYSQLPEDVYTIGFLSKYADFLGAPKDELILLYRQERRTAGDMGSFSPKIKLEEKKIYLSPRTIILGLVILFVAALLGYIFYSVRNFTSPPNLAISSPVADQVIRQDQVEVVGKTDEGVTVEINDQTILIDEKGNFHETVKLQPGLNNIEIRATNRLKKETVKVIKILAEF